MLQYLSLREIAAVQEEDSLTPEQLNAREKLLKKMEKGYSLKDELHTRNSLHER